MTDTERDASSASDDLENEELEGEEAEDDSEEKDSSAAQDKDAGEDEGDGAGKRRDSNMVPASRFNKVYRQLKEHERALQFYKEQIGDPETLVKLKRVLKEVGGDETGSGKAKPSKYSSEQKQKVREVLEEAVPELFSDIKQRESKSQSEKEAQWDRANDAVSEAAEDLGVPTDMIPMIGMYAMNLIGGDKKLLNRWEHGDISVVGKAVKQVVQQFGKHLKLASKKEAPDLVAQNRKRVAGLPSGLAGAGSVSKGKDPFKGKGLTNDVHNAAYDFLQKHRQALSE